jgi:hypothetical protein
MMDMQPPKNKAELETVLGMINYLSKFAPNLSDITSPMRKLLSAQVHFEWGESQETAFSQVKNLLTRSPGPILAYFDPQKEITLQVDASKFGLAATLLQEGHPVAYASKSLNPTEVQYAQIEKRNVCCAFRLQTFSSICLRS